MCKFEHIVQTKEKLLHLHKTKMIGLTLFSQFPLAAVV